MYGAGYFGRILCQELIKQGYNVCGFIDQKAGYIEKIEGIKVYTLEQVKVRLKNYIVIICLQNGLLHEKIAKILFEYGAKNIIFLPMYINISLKRKSEYREVYRKITNFEFENLNNIPKYIAGNDYNYIIIIDEQQKGMIFWCPIEYLRVSSKVMIDNRVSVELKSAKEILYEYADGKVQSYDPYLELMKWLEGDKNADIDLYLDAMGRTGFESRKKLLEDREELFSIYEQAYRYDMQFFLNSPATVAWNKKGYFNVDDGMHRIQYLISKGYSEAPVWTTHEDFGQFVKTLEGEFCGNDEEKCR